MHYRNGRVANNGDMILYMDNYGIWKTGILYDAKPGNDYCNGKLAHINSNDPIPNLNNCLHIDDVKALIAPTEAK